MSARTRQDAVEAADATDPVWLERLLKANELMNESKETWEAQSRRRDEAAAQLVEAGVSYADVARLLDVSVERARQLIARHLGMNVNQLNPRKKTATPTH